MQLKQATEPTSTEDRLVDVVVAAARLTRLTGAIGGDDLPRAVLRALSTLDEYGAMRISEFARIDRCSQPAATALLGRLAEAGLATRTKDPDDSRAVVAELTPAGRDRLATTRERFGTALTRRLTDFDPERLARLDRELHALVEALKTPDA
ncbi:MarR family winged helix-turn-helix transcriptional regulator [Nocardia jejuensis]|uniref:MarR family winged helix-turn-helix transcriptional regulator n=1 Tax=Nocardia jejuensis TaxID=328049 RepID=UPI00082FE9D0|nr:MarR family transcriptional regulator [Nocardia jejuensis]